MHDHLRHIDCRLRAEALLTEALDAPGDGEKLLAALRADLDAIEASERAYSIPWPRPIEPNRIQLLSTVPANREQTEVLIADVELKGRWGGDHTALRSMLLKRLGTTRNAIQLMQQLTPQLRAAGL